MIYKNSKIIYIDKFLKVVPKNKSDYKVTLSGSFEYLQYFKVYEYEIIKTEPPIDLKHILSYEFLL